MAGTEAQQKVRDLEAENEALRQAAANKDKQIADLQKSDLSDDNIAKMKELMKQTFGDKFQFSISKTGAGDTETGADDEQSEGEPEEDPFEASVSRGQEERNRPRDDSDPLCTAIPSACANTLNTWFRTIMTGRWNSRNSQNVWTPWELWMLKTCYN